jgi:phospholipase C
MRLTYIASLSITLGLVLMPALSFSQEEPLVVSQPDPDSEIAPHVTSPVTDAAASKVPEIVKLLREKVKYVFVIFQENRAFDQMFGTFPGANGLFSQPEKRHLDLLNLFKIQTGISSPLSRSGLVRRRTLGTSMT